MVERVKHMEKCMEMVQAALRKGEMHTVRRQIKTLRTYMESGQWLADYEADEHGEFPAGMKRGVLSQDGLYDLLAETDKRRGG